MIERNTDEIIETQLRDWRAELQSSNKQSDLHELAMGVLSHTVDTVEFPPELVTTVAASSPDADDLRAIVDLWPSLTPDRRWRLRQIAVDLRTASTAEQADARSYRSTHKGEDEHDQPTA